MDVLKTLFWLAGLVSWSFITLNVFHHLESDDFTLALDATVACLSVTATMAANFCKAAVEVME